MHASPAPPRTHSTWTTDKITRARWEKDPQKIVANLMELRPTFFPSVPRIFEKIHTLATTTGDRDQLEQATRVGSAVRRARERGEPVSEQLQAAFERAEQAVYGNVRNLFGGRLRQAVTGAAPIAPEILEFFYACGVPVMEGYGLTETASVATVNTLDAFRLGSVGPPLPGVEVRIADGGEILIKGPNLFNGYYRDVQATREALIDGWLHTGDLGRLDDDGFLYSPAARRTSSSPPAARTSRPPTSRTPSCKAAGSRTRS